jgi:hypothetical protein
VAGPLPESARAAADGRRIAAQLEAFMRARSLIVLVVLSLAACGDDDGGDGVVIDAPNNGDGGGDIDAPAVAQTCANYCSTITANCLGADDNQMYANAGECMASCALFPLGTAADMSGNTLGCRIYHAGNAAGSTANADTHCRHAGPGGDGLCGANCLGFCTIVLGACAGQANPPYADMAACMTACGGFAQTPPYEALATGNNFACRLYHATAASANPGTHCGHVVVNSPVCQ